MRSSMPFADRLEVTPPRVARGELASALRRLAKRCMDGVRRASCRAMVDPPRSPPRLTPSGTTRPAGTTHSTSHAETEPSTWRGSPHMTHGILFTLQYICYQLYIRFLTYDPTLFTLQVLVCPTQENVPRGHCCCSLRQLR
jgi:hypothetical protein